MGGFAKNSYNIQRKNGYMKIQSNCLLIFLIALPNFIYAQFYVGASSSANIGVNGRSLQEFLLFDATVNQSAFENTVIEKKASFGGGFLISPVIGYQVNKHIGFELQAGRYKTNSVSSTVTYTNPSDDKVSISMSGKVFTIRPSIIGYIYKSKPLIYAKLGGIYSNCEFTVQTSRQKNQTQTSILINGGQSLGISLGVGSDFSLTNRIYLRTELGYVHSNYFPEKGRFTKYDVDGVSQLPSMSDKQKTIHYVKEGNVEQTYLGAALDAGTHLSPQIPISSFGLSIALIYKINKRKTKS